MYMSEWHVLNLDVGQILKVHYGNKILIFIIDVHMYFEMLELSEPMDLDLFNLDQWSDN